VYRSWRPPVTQGAKQQQKRDQAGEREEDVGRDGGEDWLHRVVQGVEGQVGRVERVIVSNRLAFYAAS
jgi:hypothetical protein